MKDGEINTSYKLNLIYHGGNEMNIRDVVDNVATSIQDFDRILLNLNDKRQYALKDIYEEKHYNRITIPF